MDPTLEEKLLAVLWYLQERRFGRVDDPDALCSYLDDPQIAQWLDRAGKQDRIKNTRFTRR